MKIALIGASGQLGSDILRVCDKQRVDIIPIDHSQIEITDFYKSIKLLKEIKPNAIINTAAFHKVDDCEKEEDRAFLINTIGTRNLGIISNEIGIPIVHMSTDYVFDGNKKDKTSGYTEFDSPNPVNTYGLSKLKGEELLKTVTNRYYIVRVAWLFGEGGSKSKGGNFVTTMLRLAGERDELRVINDQIGSPTGTYHLAKQILNIFENPFYGVYHATCEGMTSWYEYALEIFRLAGINIKVVPVTTSEFRAGVERPLFSALENKVLKLQNANIMPHWKEALKSYMNRQS